MTSLKFLQSSLKSRYFYFSRELCIFN